MSNVFFMNRIAILALILILAVIGSCKLVNRDAYYKQDINVKPMAELRIPSVLNTIYGIPCDEVVAIDGINVHDGVFMVDKVKDRLVFMDNDITVNYSLFYTRDNALNYYSSFYKRLIKIQSEEMYGKYDRYLITYIECPRNPHVPFIPSNEYLSNVVFLKHNLVIEFYQCNDSTDVSDKEKEIKIVASYLKDYLKKQEIHQR